MQHTVDSKRQFIPAKVKKISASISIKVKKIEAQEKSVFLIKKR